MDKLDMINEDQYKLGPNMSPFQPFDFINGLISDFTNDGFKTQLSAWDFGNLSLPAQGTHFGFVHDGIATLACESGEFTLKQGMYFAVPGECHLKGQGRGIIISSGEFNGVFQLGGPIERVGRLKYIDGCTDSLLISPILMGDPCLNLLYFPPGIKQTQHTHPSNRVGIVARGTGKCIIPGGVIPLFPGQVFLIRADGAHSFETSTSDMTVIAYHPDSDFGASHENHPMINRTIVDGISAAHLKEIQTK